MEEVVQNSKFIGHSTEIIRPSKTRTFTSTETSSIGVHTGWVLDKSLRKVTNFGWAQPLLWYYLLCVSLCPTCSYATGLARWKVFIEDPKYIDIMKDCHFRDLCVHFLHNYFCFCPFILIEIVGWPQKLLSHESIVLRTPIFKFDWVRMHSF